MSVDEWGDKSYGVDTVWLLILLACLIDLVYPPTRNKSSTLFSVEAPSPSGHTGKQQDTITHMRSISQSSIQRPPLSFQPMVVPLLQITAPSIDQTTEDSLIEEDGLSEMNTPPTDTLVVESEDSLILEPPQHETIVLDLPILQPGMSQLDLSFSSF
ncbi:hypothetical protein BDF14DRAFT_1775043, partial [Spinellus fusiger]